MNGRYSCALAIAFIAGATVSGQMQSVRLIELVWETEPVASAPETVDLLLTLRVDGAISSRHEIGRFRGALLQETTGHPDLYREWWAGDDVIVNITRRSANLLAVIEIPLDEPEATRVLSEIEVPPGVPVAGVDPQE